MISLLLQPVLPEADGRSGTHLTQKDLLRQMGTGVWVKKAWGPGWSTTPQPAANSLLKETEQRGESVD